MIQLAWDSYNLLKWTDVNSTVDPTVAGRRVSSLGYYLLIGGSTVGVIVSIISGIAAEYLTMGYGIALTLTNILGAYSIKQLYLKRNLESNNGILQQNIRNLKNQIEVKKQNNKNLISNKNELNITIEDYKKTQENELQNLKNLTDQISELTSRLQASEQKLKKLTDIYDSLKSVVSTFANSSSTLLAAEHIQEDSLKNLIQTLQETSLTQAALSQEQANLEKIAQAMNAICTCISSIPSKLQEKVTMIQTGFDQSVREDSLIKEQTLQLEATQKIAKEKIDQMKVKQIELQQKVVELSDLMTQQPIPIAQLKAYSYELLYNKKLKRILKSESS